MTHPEVYMKSITFPSVTPERDASTLAIEMLGKIIPLINAVERAVAEGSIDEVGEAVDALAGITRDGLLASYNADFEEQQKDYMVVSKGFMRAIDEVLMSKHGCFPSKPEAFNTPSQILFYLMCCQIRMLAGESYAQRKLDAAHWSRKALSGYYQETKTQE